MNIIILIAILVVAFLIYRRYRDESLLGMIFKVAIKALSNNKARSFLSMLGIIIGVAEAPRKPSVRTSHRWAPTSS